MNGQKEIADMMAGYRTNPPATICGSTVVELLDYELQIGKDLESGESWDTALPKSNVLQFVTEDGSKVSARPSGTEPKIKFYFSVKTELKNIEEFDEKFAMLEAKIKAIVAEMQLG